MSEGTKHQKVDLLSSHYMGPSLFASRTPSLFAYSDRRESLYNLGSRPFYPSATLDALSIRNTRANSELLGSQSDHVKRPETVQQTQSNPQLQQLPRSQSPKNQLAHKLLGEVSDFFDTVQIANILKQMPSVKQKTQVLDLINIRREEMRQLDATLRFQKYKPLFERYRASFKERQLQKHKKFNKPLDIVAHSSEVNVRKKSRLISELGELPVQQLLSRPGSSEGSASRRLSTSQKNNSIDSPTLTLANPIDPQKLHNPQTHSSVEKTSVTPGILQLPEGLQALLVKKRDSQDTKAQQAAIDFAKDLELKRKKRIANHAKQNRLNSNKIAAGAEQLEKDLYTFLVNNERRESAKELILSPGNGRSDRIKWTEMKASERFQKYQHYKNKNISSPTIGGMLALQKLHKRSKVNEQGNMMLLNEVHFPTRNTANQTKTTNLLTGSLRNILQQEINHGKTKMVSNEVAQKKRYIDDGSLISYAKPKLDFLYRTSMDLQEGLKVTNNHIKAAQRNETYKTKA